MLSSLPSPKVNLLQPDDADQNLALRNVPESGDDDGDRMALWRLEQAEHRQKATEWLQGPKAWHDLYLCRVSLEGEVELMRSFVGLVSRDWDVQNLSTMRSTGEREFRVKLVAQCTCASIPCYILCTDDPAAPLGFLDGQ